MFINEEYYDLLDYVLEYGKTYEDTKRAGVFRRQIPHWILEYNLVNNPFPLITTKKVSWKNISRELVWFLKGDTDVKNLNDYGVRIWNKDAYNFFKKSPHYSGETFNKFQKLLKLGDVRVGHVGRIYGAQWRNWEGKLDQIKVLIDKMINNPMSTELLVTAWNPAELDDMALPPCHWSFEIIMEPLTNSQRLMWYALKHNDSATFKFVMNSYYSDKDFDKKGVPKYGFTLKWHQRSTDVFLGLPYNIASYAALAKILEKLTGHIALNLIGDLSNVHLYEEHIPMAEQQMKNNPLKFGSRLELAVLDIPDINKINSRNLILLNNDGSYPEIKAEMYERTS